MKAWLIKRMLLHVCIVFCNFDFLIVVRVFFRSFGCFCSAHKFLFSRSFLATEYCYSHWCVHLVIPLCMLSLSSPATSSTIYCPKMQDSGHSLLIFILCSYIFIFVLFMHMLMRPVVRLYMACPFLLADDECRFAGLTSCYIIFARSCKVPKLL